MTPERLKEIKEMLAKPAPYLGHATCCELVAEVERLQYEQTMDRKDIERFRATMRKAWDDRDSLAARLAVAREALVFARNELGVPQPGYPAPVANAAERISACLKELGEA